MKSPLQVNSRFSKFRFSLANLRSPVSPISPQPENVSNQHLNTSHSSGKTTPTARGTPSPDIKEHGSVNITVVDGDGGISQTPRALPTPMMSPMTPWNAAFHRNAASSEQEAKYLSKMAYLRYICILLAALMMMAGLALTAVQGDVIKRYNNSHLSSNFGLSLWPANINMKPSIYSLATGVISAFFALLSLVFLVLPSPSPRWNTKTMLFSCSTLICGILSLSLIITLGVLTPAAIFGTFISGLSSLTSTGPASTIGQEANGDGHRETILSFTCKLQNSAHAFNADATKFSLPSLSSAADLVPSGFDKMCAESKASAALVIVLLVLSLTGGVVALLTLLSERKMIRLRNEKQASRDGQPESFVASQYEKQSV